MSHRSHPDTPPGAAVERLPRVIDPGPCAPSRLDAACNVAVRCCGGLLALVSFLTCLAGSQVLLAGLERAGAVLLGPCQDAVVLLVAVCVAAGVFLAWCAGADWARGTAPRRAGRRMHLGGGRL